jgi:hypothetical protein
MRGGGRRPLLFAQVLLLALCLALALAVPARAQVVNAKTEVTNFIKAGLLDPGSYQGLQWSETVKLDASGPYVQAIRHTYRVSDPMYGPVGFDNIFFLDADGRVVGSTSTTRWKSGRWGAGREKW